MIAIASNNCKLFCSDNQEDIQALFVKLLRRAGWRVKPEKWEKGLLKVGTYFVILGFVGRSPHRFFFVIIQGPKFPLIRIFQNMPYHLTHAIEGIVSWLASLIFVCITDPVHQ